jgi:diacylglycerol kinase
VTWPLTPTEALFLGLGFALLLITELQNSSIEDTLDHLHPDHHDAVGYSKDLAAAAVLVAALFFLGVVVTILGSHFVPIIVG